MAAPAQIAQKERSTGPMRPPMATRMTVAGTRNETTASDSQKARTPTTSGAQAAWVSKNRSHIPRESRKHL